MKATLKGKWGSSEDFHPGSSLVYTYTPISIKVAPVIHDASSIFHSTHCIGVDHNNCKREGQPLSSQCKGNDGDYYHWLESGVKQQESR